MKHSLIKAKATVRRSSIDGYGVFADQDFVAGDIIEECRVLFVPDDTPSFLVNYTFYWDKDRSAMATGFGALYNHQDDSNANYYADRDNNLLVIKASRDIKSGEEIYLHYGNSWFDSREIPRLTPRFYRAPFFQLLYSVLGLLLFVSALYFIWNT